LALSCRDRLRLQATRRLRSCKTHLSETLCARCSYSQSPPFFFSDSTPAAIPLLLSSARLRACRAASCHRSTFALSRALLSALGTTACERSALRVVANSRLPSCWKPSSDDGACAVVQTAQTAPVQRRTCADLHVCLEFVGSIVLYFSIFRFCV
jgi:hypothetical protein